MFYFFEPLVIVRDWRRFDLKPWMARQKAKRGANYDRTVSDSVNLIKEIHTCNYSQVAALSRHFRKRWPSWPFFLSQSKAIASFVGCDSDIDEFRVKRCRQTVVNVTEKQLADICHARRVHVIKTVRLRVDDIEPLMQQFNDSLKIFYLHRDPRAIVSSRLRFKFNVWKLNSNEEQRFCEDIVDEQDAFQKLRPEYQKLIMNIDYNELVADMKKVSIQMMRFVGLDYHPNVARFTTNIATNTTVKVNSFMTTSHKNSSLSIERWKKELPVTNRKNIEKWCRSYMLMHNYL